MITSLPGEPIWLREGILLIKEVQEKQCIPNGNILNKPCLGIFLERRIVNNKNYIKAYIHSMGERFVEEDEVLELQSKGV